MSSDKLFGNAPFFCSFFRCDVLHFCNSFQLILMAFSGVRETLSFRETFSTRIGTGNKAKRHVPVETK
jgi:hypothetical protein